MMGEPPSSEGGVQLTTVSVRELLAKLTMVGFAACPAQSIEAASDFTPSPAAFTAETL